MIDMEKVMWKLLLSCGLVLFVGCGQLKGVSDQEDEQESWDGLLFEMKTSNGVAFTLRSKDGVVDRGTDQFLLCAEAGIDQVASVRLWMPGHNHGSTPVSLKADSSTCKVIQDVNFGMEGTWEVQVTLSDGDDGAFSMKVAD